MRNLPARDEDPASVVVQRVKQQQLERALRELEARPEQAVILRLAPSLLLDECAARTRSNS
jgi:hypothetical protein